MTNYRELTLQVSGLISGVPHLIANLANASAALWEALPNINWVGFYLLEGDTLVLGPFQGRPACIEIAPGRGVCGAAVAAGQTQLVPDVHAFPGHIACDAASRSEVVVPLRARGEIVAVLDVDSPLPHRFTEEDRAGLEQVAAVLERELEPLW
ncbi:MAG: GAF domain-containing protein [Oscillospiraceae bacterium]|nr:GAF domain-containing protein [Oscillospiraceae bacterium]